MMSKTKQRNRNGTGWPFSHAVIEAGSKSEGFFSWGTCFFSSAVFSFEEDGTGGAFSGSGLTVCSSGLTAGSCGVRVLRLLGF